MKVHTTIIENKQKYDIYLIEYPDKVPLFIKFIEDFVKSKKKRKYISIDFEYENQIIKLWQVCFYNDNEHDIFVIDVSLINNYMNIIIDKLLVAKIYKIFHGADSLDFPYLFKVIKDPKKIYKFLKYTFDTRFYCEYLKKIENVRNICGIYDAILYCNIMKKEKYDELEKLNKRIGPIWKVRWNLKIINNDLLNYVVYDVIYLKELLIELYNEFKKNNKKDIFYDLQKTNTYVLLERNNINYKMNIDNNTMNKFVIIDYYRNIIQKK